MRLSLILAAGLAAASISVPAHAWEFVRLRNQCVMKTAGTNNDELALISPTHESGHKGLIVAVRKAGWDFGAKRGQTLPDRKLSIKFGDISLTTTISGEPRANGKSTLGVMAAPDDRRQLWQYLHYYFEESAWVSLDGSQVAKFDLNGIKDVWEDFNSCSGSVIGNFLYR